MATQVSILSAQSILVVCQGINIFVADRSEVLSGSDLAPYHRAMRFTCRGEPCATAYALPCADEYQPPHCGVQYPWWFAEAAYMKAACG